MREADVRSFEDSVYSLTDAFNNIERMVKPLIDSGEDLLETEQSQEYYTLLTSYFVTLYKECEFITDNYSARLTEDKLSYLYHLRNLCAHRFGSTMSTHRLIDETAKVILPMKESIRSMLFDALVQEPNPELEKRVRMFNRKSRW